MEKFKRESSKVYHEIKDIKDKRETRTTKKNRVTREMRGKLVGRKKKKRQSKE